MSIWSEPLSRSHVKQVAKTKTFKVVVSLFLILVLCFVGVAFSMKKYLIPSESMVPTFKIDDYVLADKVIKPNPQVGDIMIFHPPFGALDNSCAVAHAKDEVCLSANAATANNIHFVKRVVGMPGDRIKIVDGRVYRNGKKANEPFVNTSKDLIQTERAFDCDICQIKEFTVPEGNYFMLGDNRGMSEDSRVWGMVPKKAFVGKVRAVVWPINRFDWL